jgi:ADP-heptose:LPS heptosyltransferase
MQALRETFPDAEIVYLGKAWHKKFLTGRPGPVDRVEVIPPYPGVGEREDLIPDEELTEAFFYRMREEAFDIAFQMHGGGFYSNPFLKKLGAKLTVGLKTSNAEPLDINIPYINVHSEILRFLEVVSYVGATTKNIEPRIAVTEKDLTEAYAIIRQHPEEKPVAVIHPGASDLRRRWPAKNFAAIADFLAGLGYQIYLSGVEFERDIIEEILSYTSHSDIYDLCGNLPLAGLTGLLSFADIVVSNDTGPLHLARALKTPSVGIFWTLNSLTAIPITPSLHRSLISWDPYCPLCRTDCIQADFYREYCEHKTSFTGNISVEEVKRALQELLMYAEIKTSV